ncbi:Hypothetical protein, putative [Bodo saltans]|uniref:Uncharacterized protein n=1 Tax=Bodo saltans TaxID=75058 RepID=A0A0S4IHY9_BODSA|nr:Hypothetical protein, putative [Bodo saltans]|eukprot:CUE70213.1 Hypothetical protein, putative [Bodo saltans]
MPKGANRGSGAFLGDVDSVVPLHSPIVWHTNIFRSRCLQKCFFASRPRTVFLPVVHFRCHMERRCMVAYRVIESVPFDVTTTPLSQSISPWAIALRHKPKVAAGDMLFGRIVVEGMTTHEFPLVEEDIGAEVDKGQNVVNLVASIGHSACRVGNEIQRFTAASLALDVLVVPWSLLRLVAYIPPSLSAAASTSVGACIRQWLMSRRVVRKHEVVLYPQQAGVVVPILLVRTSEPDDNVQFVVADNVHRQLILTFATQLCTRCRITDAIAMGSLLFHNESITDDDGKDHQSVDDVVPLPSRHAPAIHLILKHVQALPMTTRTDNFSISWPVVIVPFEILSSEGGAGTLTVRLGNMRDFVAVTVIPFAADDGWGCTQRVAEGLEGKIVRPSEASPTALTFTTRHRVTLLTCDSFDLKTCAGVTNDDANRQLFYQLARRDCAL